jgi:hypothetical protein
VPADQARLPWGIHLPEWPVCSKTGTRSATLPESDPRSELALRDTQRRVLAETRQRCDWPTPPANEAARRVRKFAQPRICREILLVRQWRHAADSDRGQTGEGVRPENSATLQELWPRVSACPRQSARPLTRRSVSGRRWHRRDPSTALSRPGSSTSPGPVRRTRPPPSRISLQTRHDRIYAPHTPSLRRRQALGRSSVTSQLELASLRQDPADSS